MAPRPSAAAEEEVEEQGMADAQQSLQFNEPLSWRPGRAIPIDTLLKRLDKLSKELSEFDQELVDHASLTDIAKDVISLQLLTHKDKAVRAYTACCVVDILRLCAPNAPFTPTQVKVCHPPHPGALASLSLSLSLSCLSALTMALFRISST